MPKKKVEPTRRDTALNLRVPRDVKDALQQAANEDDRSMSSMAVHLLRRQLEASGHLRKD